MSECPLFIENSAEELDTSEPLSLYQIEYSKKTQSSCIECEFQS